MRVTELDGHQAAQVVDDWGYPRALDAAEVNHSKWFSYGPHVVWWLNRNVLHKDRELSLHICIDPAFRGRVYGRKFLYAVEIVGELLHAERLVSWMPKDSPTEGYLARMGWQEVPLRSTQTLAAWVRELGGEGHGWRE